MSQSLAKNFIHIVFSTKNRKHLIDENIEKELHLYITGICKDLESTAIKVGGYSDHIHILCLLSKKIALMTLVQKIKGNSSKWIKHKGENYSKFYWQDGYGAFSVNPKQINEVSNYIEKQKILHNNKNYKDEFLGFLKSYKMDYDEKYLWD